MSPDKYEGEGLRKAGLKVTLPRMKILHILENAGGVHMSAEVIYKKLVEAGDDVGLATVYRVLTQFAAAGLVIKHYFESEHAVFELNEGHHHDHLVCVHCGKVEEFVDHMIEARQEMIAKQFGFEITDHSLCLYGACSDCRDR